MAKNDRRDRDRRKIERREGKRGVNIRHTDTSPDDSKRVRRGKALRRLMSK